MKINPFNSNRNGYLFQKNYGILNRNESEPQVSLPGNQSSAKMQLLIKSNPYTRQAHGITNFPSRVSPATDSTPRSLSSSRLINDTISSRILYSKPKLLEADHWKKQLQYKEREKLQYYGAEGLRYNSYSLTHSNTQTLTNNHLDSHKHQYYATNHNAIPHPAKDKDKRNSKFQERDNLPQNLNYNYSSSGNNNSHNNNNYNSNNYNSNSHNSNAHMRQGAVKRKKSKEQFEDNMQYYSSSFRNSKVEDYNSLADKLKMDDFVKDSHEELLTQDVIDRGKNSMAYNSYGSSFYGNGEEDMLESKQIKFHKVKSKFQEGPFNMNNFSAIESEVQYSDINMPHTIIVAEKTYFKISI